MCGTYIIRNIPCPDPVLFFISIRFHIRIISMAAVIRCGRLCGVLKVMIAGRWVGEKLQISIIVGDAIRNGSVFFVLEIFFIIMYRII
jgi:hypothetical protein